MYTETCAVGLLRTSSSLVAALDHHERSTLLVRRAAAESGITSWLLQHGSTIFAYR